jgi:hypothetical protein
VVATIAATGLAGAAAAYAGVLPAPVQRLAHVVVGAPAAHPAAVGATPAGRRESGSPAIRGPAPGSLAGLCVSYEHRNPASREVGRPAAVRELVRAAGGASQVAAFCAALPHPGAGPHPTAGPPSAGSPRHGAQRGHPDPRRPGNPHGGRAAHVCREPGSRLRGCKTLAPPAFARRH